MKEFTKSALAATALLCATVAAAQGVPPHPMGGGMTMGGPPWGGNGGGNRGGGGGGSNGNGGGNGNAATVTAESLPPAEMAQMMAELREKHPEEFRKISELRQTDRRAAMEQLRALAEKDGLKFPGAGQNAAAGNQSLRTSKPASRLQPKRNAVREIRMAEKRIASHFPEEYPKLVELRKTNLPAFRRRFRELYMQLPPAPEKSAPPVADSPAEWEPTSPPPTNRRESDDDGNFAAAATPPEGTLK